MPKITYIDKKSFVGSLVDTDYQGCIDEATLERIKNVVKRIAGNVDNIEIWTVPIEQVDVLCNRVLICWEYNA